MSGRTQGVRLRRTWPQRMLIVFNVGCIVAALAAAGTIAYAKRTTNQIDRFELSALKPIDELSDTDPRNFLIVGNDSDDGLDDDDPARVGRDDVAGVRSDTIMVVRVDPKDNEVKILSLPRDLWVEIPGHGDSRINSSLTSGGPDLLIQTIKADFDIDINHYVQIDFAGFQDLVKALDGVPIWFDHPVRDQGGLNIQNPGCTTLDENGALQYVRARHYQMQVDGRWESDPLSDLSRIQRQQDFIKRILRRAIKQGGRNPQKLAQFISIGARSLTLDGSTTINDLVSLGNALRNFDPETLKSYSVPVTDAEHGGAKVLEIQPGPAEPVLSLFRGTGTPEQAGSILPATVEVVVANGTGVQNQATTTSDGLEAAGFQTLEPAGDTATTRTTVAFPVGHEAEAVLVARYLEADPLLVPNEDTDQTAIVVTTGPDFVRVLERPRPPTDIDAPATTTTLATTTTTAAATTTTVRSETTDDDVTSTSGVDENGVQVTVPSDFVPQGAPAGESCG